MVTGDNGALDNGGAAADVIRELALNRKKRKKIRHGEAPSDANNTAYYDVSNIICATSSCCERLFSKAKYILLPHRRGMSLLVFEALLFLKENISFWDVSTVGKAMKMKEDDIRGLQRDEDDFYWITLTEMYELPPRTAL